MLSIKLTGVMFKIAEKLLPNFCYAQWSFVRQSVFTVLLNNTSISYLHT